MNSLWTQTARLPHFPALSSDLNTEVLIIGGGLAGLLCAYALTEAGMDCALVEANRIAGGITGNTTAKITVQHGLIYQRLLREFDVDRARLYLRANREALERYRTLCRNIDCGFEERDSFVYTLHDSAKPREEQIALARLGLAAELTDTLPSPVPSAEAIRVRGQAQFHPLKFLASISRGLRIFEHTKVLELGPGKAVTNRGTVTAKKIVVATHFPLLNKHGGYFLKLYQHRSYVLALRNAPELDGMYLDENTKGLSFRNYQDLLLLGGGSHRTGKQGGNWRELREFAQARLPGAEEVGHWAAQDCMTLDGMPYIGRYSRGTEGLYVATGFNKWGMTWSMAAASILTDLLQGQENPYAEAFSPQRSSLRPQLAVNLLESTVGLLTPTVPRCPHMGCALKYNAAEHSYDCPCHGSRFGEDGKLLDNPATDDKRR